MILSDSRTLRFATFAGLYVAQGLPIGLITIALPAWLTEQGASAGQIASFIAITGLPWGFKLFAGPVMDRFTYLPMGRRRPWVVGAQTGLVLAILAMGLVPDPVNNIVLLTWMGFLVNCFGAVQDVAVDGMAIDVLPEDERGRANAFMGFGQVAGYAGSGALSATLLVAYGIQGAAWSLALGVILIWLLAIFVRERPDEKYLPWTTGTASPHALSLVESEWRTILLNLVRVLFLPTSLALIVVVLCWRTAGGFWLTLAPYIAVQELGFASTDYSWWSSVASFVAAVSGVLLGPVIDRSGPLRILVTGLICMSLLYLVAGLTASLWALPAVALAILFAEALFGQVLFVSAISVHMNICWLRVSATQFAIYMAWANLSRSIGSAVYGAIEPLLSLSQAFLVMAAICAVGVGVALMIRLDRHDEVLRQLDAEGESDVESAEHQVS